jgi:hypothetical protein
VRWVWAGWVGGGECRRRCRSAWVGRESGGNEEEARKGKEKRAQLLG